MRTYTITFSPTGGTKKVADILSGALWQQVSAVDLTDSHTDFGALALTAEDVALIAVPSFSGRVPEIACQRLAAIQGGGAKAVLVCVYGNRAYDDTLLELLDVAKQAGFRSIAAVAAVAEHSILRQFAAGRPDAQDTAQLLEYAAQIREKLATWDVFEPRLPGNRPYRPTKRNGLIPRAGQGCTSCGRCAQKCPVQAIDHSDPKVVDSTRCIACMRCVSICPQSARKLDDAALAALHTALKKVCGTRKDAVLYI